MNRRKFLLTLPPTIAASSIIGKKVSELCTEYAIWHNPAASSIYLDMQQYIITVVQEAYRTNEYMCTVEQLNKVHSEKLNG